MKIKATNFFIPRKASVKQALLNFTTYLYYHFPPLVYSEIWLPWIERFGSAFCHVSVASCQVSRGKHELINCGSCQFMVRDCCPLLSCFSSFPVHFKGPVQDSPKQLRGGEQDALHCSAVLWLLKP